MRKRPSPEAPARAGRVRLGVAVALAVLALWSVSSLVRAQAEKGLVGDRIDRVAQAQTAQQAAEKADTTPWAPEKIVINLDARCPVVTALGYFGAFATTDPDPAKAAELQSRYARLQKSALPLADELKKMAVSNNFVGRKFPAELRPRLNVMSAGLYGDILKIYGDDSLTEFKRYVTAQAQGVYVPD